jgi:thiol-disulfide isomerase/thioredoxin
MLRANLIAAFTGLLLVAPAHAQYHEPDAAATRAFADMVMAYRQRHALTVRAEIELQILHEEQESRTQAVKAEFLFLRGAGQEKNALVKLRDFTVLLKDGTITAVHDRSSEAYFITGDEGSPYYTLLFMFADLPFPHLAVFLGEEDLDDLLMQFHPKAPWARPTAVREEKPDDEPVQIITLTSDFEHMDIAVDPKTRLIQSIDLRITDGPLVMPGYTLAYRHKYEYEAHEHMPVDALAIDIGEAGNRRRVDALFALVPAHERPSVPAGRVALAPGALINQPAPAFRLPTLGGGVIDLESLRGRVVVLDFWATWCGPCIQGLPLLHEVDRWVKEESLPVTIVTINTWEDPNMEAREERAREFWARREFILPVAMDFDDSVSRAYGLVGVPTTFVIRADGIVHVQHAGLPDDLVAQLRGDIREAIAAGDE